MDNDVDRVLRHGLRVGNTDADTCFEQFRNARVVGATLTEYFALTIR